MQERATETKGVYQGESVPQGKKQYSGLARGSSLSFRRKHHARHRNREQIKLTMQLSDDRNNDVQVLMHNPNCNITMSNSRPQVSIAVAFVASMLVAERR
jgi:hypothetical protein